MTQRQAAIDASIVFNDHVRRCPVCGVAPASGRLCIRGHRLNDAASTAAAKALLAELQEERRSGEIR
jgi:hypothetical protein